MLKRLKARPMRLSGYVVISMSKVVCLSLAIYIKSAYGNRSESARTVHAGAPAINTLLYPSKFILEKIWSYKKYIISSAMPAEA